MSQQEVVKSSIYEKLYRKELAFDEVAGMQSNLVGFFLELIEADKEKQLTEEKA